MSQSNEIHISDDDSNDGIDECQRDLTPDLNGGVLKQIVQGGKYRAKPILDDDVLIHVVGTLKKAGKVFYNTRKLEKPWKTKLHSPDLPEAIDLALRTMKKQEIAILHCKPEYCYKDKSFRGKNFKCEVPANSEIVFEVELLDFRFEDLTKDKDGGLLFMKRFIQGSGNFYPTYDSEVCCDIVSYTGAQELDEFSNIGDPNNVNDHSMSDECDPGNIDEDNKKTNECMNDSFVVESGDGDTKIAKIYSKKGKPQNVLKLVRIPALKYVDKQDFTWTLGDGELEHLAKGVEMAIENLTIGEKALFMIRYDYLKEMLSDEEYAEYKARSEFNYFIVTLKSCRRAKEYYEMSGEERLHESFECKKKGNYYLTKKSNIKLALKRFKRAIDLLETSIDLDGENSERDALLVTCYLNISKAYFDACTPDLCAEYLEKALKMQPTNEKAMYRLGLLMIERKDYDEARMQFEKLLVHYPLNKAAIHLRNKCKLNAQIQASQQHKLCKLMSKAFTN